MCEGPEPAGNESVCRCVRPKHIWMGIGVNGMINQGCTHGVRDAAVTEHEGQQNSGGKRLLSRLIY